MTHPTSWLAGAAGVASMLGLVLVLVGQGMRRRRGLGSGQTVSLDRVTLTSRRLGLVGRPDRLIRTGGTVIVEEWKSARTLKPSHQAQLGVYFLLIEDQMGIRPSHGFLVTGNGIRHQIENTEDLRAWVRDMAEQIRTARQAATVPIPVRTPPGLCRACGQKGRCIQARA